MLKETIDQVSNKQMGPTELETELWNSRYALTATTEVTA